MAEFFGKLQVTVTKARDLFATDVITGKSDAYVVLELDRQRFKTKVIHKDINPIWNETFTFNVNKAFGVLELFVWDEKTLGSDAFIGRVLIPLADIAGSQEPTQAWYKLQKRNEKDVNVKGEVLLQMHYKYMAVWDNLYKAHKAVKDKSWTAAFSHNCELRLLEECINKYPDLWNLFALRSEAYLAQGKAEEALSDAKRVIELNPNSAEGYYRIGMVYFMSDEYEQAEEVFKLGLKYEPDFEPISKAIEDMKKNTIKQQVRKAIQRGRQAFEKEEYDLAIEYFNDAINSNPKNSSYYVYRCITYLAKKSLDLAHEDALKIVQLLPTWPKYNAIKQGYLQKEGQVNVMMKKRWFILKEYFIYYYNSSKDLKPNGVILLADFDLQKRQKKYFRIVTPQRTYELKADNETDRDSWLTVLEVILNKPKLVLPVATDKEDDVILDSTSTQPLAPLAEVLGHVASSTVAVPGMVHPLFLSTSNNTSQLASTVTGKIVSKLSTITMEGVEKEGYLYKMGQFHKSFRKRYCIIKDRKLYYFNIKEEEARKSHGLTPAGFISLENCKIESAQQKAGKEFAFEIITPNRGYIMSAVSEHDMSEWIKAILKAAAGTVIASDLQPPQQLQQQQQPPTQPVDTSAELSHQHTQHTQHTQHNHHHHVEENKMAEPIIEFKELDTSDVETPPPSKRVSRHVELKEAGNMIQTIDDIANDENTEMRHALGHGETSSESRYFLKFGLTPPPGPQRINNTAQQHSTEHEPYKTDAEWENEPFLEHRSGSRKRHSKKKDKDSGCCSSCTIL